MESSPDSAPSHGTRPRAYRIEAMPEPGEKIMAEIPILRGTTDDLKQQSYMNSVLAQLSNTKRKKFQKLYNAFPEQDDVGIVRTNSFALGCNTDLAAVDQIRKGGGTLNKMWRRSMLFEELKPMKKSLDYMDAEGLFGSFKARICYDGYQLALRTRDLREAKRFIQMSYDQYRLGTGPNSQETRKMLGYVQNPTSHIEWDLHTPVEGEEHDDDEEDLWDLLKYFTRSRSFLADL